MKEKSKHSLLSIIVGIILGLAILAPFSQSSNIKNETTGTPIGWTNDIRLTNSSYTDAYQSISVSGGQVHITWRKLLADKSEIYYINSTDAGQSWNGPIQLSGGISGVYCMYPNIGVNVSHVHVVWDDNDAIGREVKYRSSTDGGITWSPSKMISADDGWKSAESKIGINSSELHIVWIDERHREESIPWNTEIYYVRSLDGGITWDDGLGNVGQERRITNALYESCGQEISVEGDAVHLVWGDTRNGIISGEIYYKRSLDKGATWDDGLGNINQDRVLTTNLTNSHGLPTIAVNGTTIHAAWVDVWPGPNYYIYYRNSTDNGVTWGPIKLLVGPFPGSGYRPKLAVDENTVQMVWMDMRDDGTTREIYYKNSTNAGADWGTDLRLTYNEGNDSWWPEIDVYKNTAHVTWYDLRDGNREIYYKRSPDFSTETDPPAHANETPSPDSYKDAPGTNISVHVTDPSGVNESTIQLWINGSLVSHTLTSITDGYNVSYESPGFDPGVVECRIVADDNCSNTLDYTWNFTVLALYEIQLVEGWNLISVPHVQVDTAINEVLRDIDGKWDYIQWYDASDPSDHWKSYTTFKPESLNDLFEINRTMAIWINITEPNVNLTVRGHLSTYTEIQLYAGWNLVGYSTQTTETVANALWGTGADRVEVFNATAPYRIKEVGPSYVMKPGEGYWVHVVADSVWVVNW